MPYKEAIVGEIFEMLKGGSDDLDILYYFQEKNIDAEAQKEMLAVAKEKLLQEKLKYLPKRNKTIFSVWLSLALFVFVFAVFFLPYMHVLEYAFILGVLATVALVFCCYMAMMYYKSWTTDFLQHRDSPLMNFSFFPIFLIPGGIIYFIISWRFSSAADTTLAQNMQKATGTIISGSSVTVRKIDFSEVTVRFTTKEGKEILATEDISKYTFKQFYKGQIVELVYSATDPMNIDLLTRESDIKAITGSEDRDITPGDLIAIMEVSSEKTGEFLDKINFGWSFSGSDSAWINNRKNMLLVAGNNQVVFITNASAGFTFPKNLISMGFKPAATNSTVPFTRAAKLFENDVYKAIVQLKALGEGTEGCVVTIIKK